MTMTPEYVALEARVTNLERDYRRDLTTKLTELQQVTKSLVVWSTEVDKRLASMDGKLDMLLALANGAPDTPADG